MTTRRRRLGILPGAIWWPYVIINSLLVSTRSNAFLLPAQRAGRHTPLIPFAATAPPSEAPEVSEV